MFPSCFSLCTFYEASDSLLKANLWLFSCWSTQQLALIFGVRSTHYLWLLVMFSCFILYTEGPVMYILYCSFFYLFSVPQHVDTVSLQSECFMLCAYCLQTMLITQRSRCVSPVQSSDMQPCRCESVHEYEQKHCSSLQAPLGQVWTVCTLKADRLWLQFMKISEEFFPLLPSVSSSLPFPPSSASSPSLLVSHWLSIFNLCVLWLLTEASRPSSPPAARLNGGSFCPCQSSRGHNRPTTELPQAASTIWPLKCDWDRVLCSALCPLTGW